MNFLKANKTFSILIVLFICIFSILQFISCSATGDIETALNLISKESSSIINLEEELLLYDGLENEVIESKNDLIQLSKIEKTQSRFWQSIINPDENIFLNFNDKSSESINADLTRLYSSLRDLCSSNNIIFKQATLSNSITNFGDNTTVDEEKYGFGLSSYDGFWPSFSKQEAKLLGVQSKIIATMVEYLANSSDEKYAITLVQIQRESAGSVDSNHIGDDELSSQNYESNLIRYEDKIGSFAFTVSFQSHTSHARSFINQLRTPFLVRDIKVNRSTISNESILAPGFASPFGEEEQKKSLQLPIVKDVKSTFTLLIEYIYEIDRDFENFILQNIKSFDIDEDVLKLFLEETGNSKLLSKIQKNFKKS
jgi:hypothetical protein